MEYKQKELEGSLFSKNEAQVVGKGQIQFNGSPTYMALVKSRLPDGTEILELMASVGRIYMNDPKETPSHPDMGGTVTYNNISYRASGWENTSANGSDYITMKLTAKNEQAPF